MRPPLDGHPNDLLLGCFHPNPIPVTALSCNREAGSLEQRAAKTTDTTTMPPDTANLTKTPSLLQLIVLTAVVYKDILLTMALMGTGTMITKSTHRPTFRLAGPLLWLGVGVNKLISMMFSTLLRV